MLKFGNVITAMVTPFYENGNIDFDEFDSLARYLLGNGSDGLLVAGTTGEGATLTEEERLRLFRFAADEYGDRTMIMANVGSNNTAASVGFSKKTEKRSSRMAPPHRTALRSDADHLHRPQVQTNLSRHARIPALSLLDRPLLREAPALQRTVEVLATHRRRPHRRHSRQGGHECIQRIDVRPA